MIFLQGLFLVMGALTLGCWTYLGILKVIWLCEDWHIEELGDRRDALKIEIECLKFDIESLRIKKQIKEVV